MRTLVVFVLTAVSLWTPALTTGQSLVVVPSGELQDYKETMDRAREAWRKSDKNLERDVFRMPQQKALERIDTAAERARAFKEAEGDYYDAFLARLRDAVSSLSSAKDKFDGELFKSRLDQKVRVVGDVERDLEQASAELLRTNDPKKLVENSELEAQLRSLRDLRKNLEQQGNAVEEVTAKAHSLEEARQGLRASYSALLDLVTANAAEAKAEGSTWAKYYDSLREVVSNRKTDVHPSEKKATSEKGRR
jgi:predicted  nucleic acid-binding Zn-ribbon protein